MRAKLSRPTGMRSQIGLSFALAEVAVTRGVTWSSTPPGRAGAAARDLRRCRRCGLPVVDEPVPMLSRADLVESDHEDLRLLMRRLGREERHREADPLRVRELQPPPRLGDRERRNPGQVRRVPLLACSRRGASASLSPQARSTFLRATAVSMNLDATARAAAPVAQLQRQRAWAVRRS